MTMPKLNENSLLSKSIKPIKLEHGRCVYFRTILQSRSWENWAVTYQKYRLYIIRKLYPGGELSGLVVRHPLCEASGPKIYKMPKLPRKHDFILQTFKKKTKSKISL